MLREKDPIFICQIIIIAVLILLILSKDHEIKKDNIAKSTIETISAEEIGIAITVKEKPVKVEIVKNDEVKVESIVKDDIILLSDKDKYLLAKIAMAEAENQNIQTKSLIIYTVLNRMESGKFEDTIEGVINQNDGKVWQFSPLCDGRWEKIEPNEDCYEALNIVLTSPTNYSGGSLYFESSPDDENWHSKHLTFLYKSNDMKFYK